MGRRTRKQKEKIASQRNIGTGSAEVVNRGFGFRLRDIQKHGVEAKVAKRIDKSPSFGSTGLYTPDLIKSLGLALTIVSLEMVLYWFQA
ncbi:MAG: hypothetical protein A2700_02855 [Candidatus Blackburnbacteria bacterium RIFCSPHIGHO2_01_FULL_44_64]|nr:MAG: hypothetical protein A2700_02855 [Candidatus Blackburnbacteria bacterium RIFCSPHIGHO2_01_FULL_44_64]OGY14170.1 MAG: hypothetical protein A3A62_01830 [Candidatus Blackburnbacteria bacterium RIFCSPLOWO2_01_FULL_44_43]